MKGKEAQVCWTLPKEKLKLESDETRNGLSVCRSSIILCHNNCQIF